MKAGLVIDPTETYEIDQFTWRVCSGRTRPPTEVINNNQKIDYSSCADMRPRPIDFVDTFLVDHNAPGVDR